MPNGDGPPPVSGEVYEWLDAIERIQAMPTFNEVIASLDAPTAVETPACPYPNLRETDVAEYYAAQLDDGYQYYVRWPNDAECPPGWYQTAVYREGGFRTASWTSYARGPQGAARYIYRYHGGIGRRAPATPLRGLERRAVRNCHGYPWILPDGRVVISTDTWSHRHGRYYKLTRTGIHPIIGPNNFGEFRQSAPPRGQRLNNPQYTHLVSIEDYYAAPARYRSHSRVRQARIEEALGADPGAPPAEATWWEKYVFTQRPEGRHWLKIGGELEGGWPLYEDELRAICATHGGDATYDGSVEDICNSRYIGEVRLPACDSFDKFAEALAALHPSEINDSCGYHIHVSFTEDDYARLLDERFYFYFLLRWQAWGQRRGIPRHHEFWKRWAGDNTYCQRAFVGVHDGDRYHQLNYCYTKHGTIECRMLPMFDDAEDAEDAARELLSIYEDYLAMYGEEPVVPETPFPDEFPEGEGTSTIEVVCYETPKDSETETVEVAEFPLLAEHSIFVPPSLQRRFSGANLQTLINRGDF